MHFLVWEFAIDDKKFSAEKLTKIAHSKPPQMKCMTNIGFWLRLSQKCTFYRIVEYF